MLRIFVTALYLHSEKMPKVQTEYKFLFKGKLSISLSSKGGWQKIGNLLAGVVTQSGRLLRAAFTKRENHIKSE